MSGQPHEGSAVGLTALGGSRDGWEAAARAGGESQVGCDGGRATPKICDLRREGWMAFAAFVGCKGWYIGGMLSIRYLSLGSIIFDEGRLGSIDK